MFLSKIAVRKSTPDVEDVEVHLRPLEVVRRHLQRLFRRPTQIAGTERCQVGSLVG
jgi:hypothetical protein